MLFNSVEFMLFFPIVTALFYLLPHRHRWWMLLSASCYFYMSFVPIYILILLGTILVDYYAAIWIEESEGKHRRWFLIMSILATCAILFAFKYFNFFNANFAGLASLLHWNYPIEALKIALPIGLSFHTFQSLSYVIEVYRGHQKAERHFGIYSLYVMFYPQLVAGPIERPQNLLGQFRTKHTFNYDQVSSGLKLMAWGLFKKVVIADRLALFVNAVYDHPADHHGLSLLIATVFFSIQIYCDFSGYSDIAIGSARVMGFDLMTNFMRPYYSKSISEFWKRWHISLSTWFKDYLYVPMGGSRVSTHRVYLNLMVTFLVSGLWHGASWTYVVWGALNGFYLIFGLATKTTRDQWSDKIGLSRFPQIRKPLQVFTTFSLVSFSWVFFRARSLQDAFLIIRKIATEACDLAQTGIVPIFMGFSKKEFLWALVVMIVLELAHHLQKRGSVCAYLRQRSSWMRWPAYFFVIYGVLFFGAFSADSQFIYFQF